MKPNFHLIRPQHLPSLVLITEQNSFSQHWSADKLTLALNGAPYHNICLLDGDTISGFLLSHVVADEAELIHLQIAENYQRQGLAKNLLHQAVSIWQAEGAKQCFLEVNMNNLAAKKLYLSYGFYEVGCRKNYYLRDGKREDALLFSLTLPLAY